MRSGAGVVAGLTARLAVRLPVKCAEKWPYPLHTGCLVWLGHPANLSVLNPGPTPLRLAGYPQLLAGAFGGSTARVSWGALNHARHRLWKG